MTTNCQIKIRPHTSKCAPTVRVFANGNGEDTDNIELNTESAKYLIEWLQFYFVPTTGLTDKRLAK